MNILGISAYYHDSAAALIQNGDIIAAAQEERFTRIKHDPSFPVNAIKFCLSDASLKLSNIDYIIFYDKPFLKFDRIFETYLSFAPKGFKSFSKSLPLWIKDKLFQKKLIEKELFSICGSIDLSNKLLFSEHHLSHAASAFFPSPFKDAAILTMDGVGEWATTSLSIGNENKLSILKEIFFPHSLGLLYSAFTFYTGFKVNSGEYKLMGLAPYGEPKYANKIEDYLIDIKEDGSFHLDMSFFDYCTGLQMTNEKFNELFGGPPRKSETKITQKEMDLAASIQLITEKIILRLAKNIAKETQQKNLCLAGGVALNCVANGKILENKVFDNIWIQPASGDAGGAIGAALSAYYIMLKNDRSIEKSYDKMNGSYLGPKFSDETVAIELDKKGAVYELLSEKEMIDKTARVLAEGKAVGWMQGRMEFGPRALGARSILADPRSKSMQRDLNLKVKFRESFRPFAPSVLLEDVNNFFDLDKKSPYMMLVSKVKQDKRLNISNHKDKLFGIEKLNLNRSIIPSVTHVDYSARIQTVNNKTNRRYYDLIKRFKELTDCSVLINTSFNVRGEPIVCNPVDAYNCFMGTEIEYLVIGNIFLNKKEQPKELLSKYENKYELD